MTSPFFIVNGVRTIYGRFQCKQTLDVWSFCSGKFWNRKQQFGKNNMTIFLFFVVYSRNVTVGPSYMVNVLFLTDSYWNLNWFYNLKLRLNKVQGLQHQHFHLDWSLVGGSIDFFLNVFTLNSVTTICHYSKRIRSWPPLVREVRMLSKHQQDKCERQNLKIQPNSCFSDLSVSLNSLNSCSILGKLEIGWLAS